MKESWGRLHPVWVAGVIVAVLTGLAGLAGSAPASEARDERVSAAAPSPAGPALTISSEVLFQELLSHNQWREDRLRAYSVKRVYRVTNGKGALSAEEHVSLEFEAPSTKRYTVTSEKGSSAIRRLVFKRLLDSEVETAGGRLRRDNALSPANYRFDVLGEEQLDGRPCYLVEATPTRKAKYLFRGKLWIDAQDFAVAKVDGEPAANPSWWTKKIHFVRHFQKIGDFWLPRSDESVNQVRIFGTHILTIEHQDYEVAGSKN